jgi:chloride channel 7
MVVLLLAKWTGDYFNEGIYDMHIHLAKVPILEWEPRSFVFDIRAREVMNTSVVCMQQDMSVDHICKVLSDPSNNHSGYPVIDKSGKFRGLILRSQLLILLKHKVFVERNAPGQSISLSVFRDSYPRYFPISSINVTSEDMPCTVDLRPFANQAPYTVHEDASFPRIFRIFRSLGLRHLVVLNENYKVVGMVTRKDIWQIQHEKIS